MREINKLLVIAGSAKTGTTSVVNWLKQRDDMVLGSQKEPKFFANFEAQTWSGPASEGFVKSRIDAATDYAANFPDLQPDQWAIDGSTDYIWADGVADRLSELRDGTCVKVICTVRDPLSRAISEYNHTLRHSWENLTFADSLKAEVGRIAEGWHPLFYHVRRSQIHDDIHRFHDVLGEDLLILDYHELKSPEDTLKKIESFLGVEAAAVDTSKAHNVSLLGKNQLAGIVKDSKFLKSVGRALLPAWVKRRLWASLHVDAKKKVTVTEAEKAIYCAMLHDEIKLCVESPLIPTQHWNLTELGMTDG